MLRAAKLTAAATFAVGNGLATGTPAQAASSASADEASAARTRVVVSPRPGQVVRSHLVRLRVRAGGDSSLRVRLNGTALGGDFAPARSELRRLQASISHGLRRGPNVLRVTVRRPGARPRRATVRFAVRTGRPLVGAGRHRVVSVGGAVRLAGRVAGGGHLPVRWQIVRAPRRAPLHRLRGTGPSRLRRAPRGRSAAAVPAALTDPVTGLPVTVPPATVPDAGDVPALGPIVPAPPAAVVQSPAAIAPLFQATVPGRYTLRLTVGSGSRQTTTTTTLDATPRNKLVPVTTMTSPFDDQRGIAVGGSTYLLRDAVARGAADPNAYLQVVVLDRRTLEFVWNRRYGDAGTLGSELATLDSTKLVILVLQPAGGHDAFFSGFLAATEQIGMPRYDVLPTRSGQVSLIGVPGMAPGQADVNVYTAGLAPMTGYLTPDLFSGFGFVASGRVPFSYASRPSDPCVRNAGGGRSCSGDAGFSVRVQNSRTLQPTDRDGRFYATGSRNGSTASEAARMAADLAAIPSEDVVTIRAVSFVGSSGSLYGSPVANVPKATMVQLATAVANIGGSLNGFNTAAHTQAPLASGGSDYTLVGWQGAGAGNGAEASVGVDGVGDAASLSGILRPDAQSRYQPAQVTATDYGPDLTDSLLAPPTTAWPLDGNARATAALSYLGTLDRRLGPDPRSAYWTQDFPDATTWSTLSGIVRGARYDDVPPASRALFDSAGFLLAQSQLANELTWVGNVRGYLTAVARPFDDNALRSWEDAELIADQIYSDAYRPDADVAEVWLTFTEDLLNLLGPLTDDATVVVADMMELGTWMFDSDAEGRPSGADLKIKADQVAGALSSQMQDAAKSYWNIGSVIVSDPAKLAAIGPQVYCNPGRGCPDQWSFTNDQSNQVSADLARNVERTAYEKLYPLGFRIFRLNPDIGGSPRDPASYHCGYYHPWSEYSDLGKRYALTALLQEYDPQGPGNSWQGLALAASPSGSTVHGQPPSDDVLRRMFGAVPSPAGPDGENYRAGGLGISASELMREAEPEWDYWSPASYNRPTYDTCYWDR